MTLKILAQVVKRESLKNGFPAGLVIAPIAQKIACNVLLIFRDKRNRNAKN